jgi:hypothetical protein
MGCSIAVHYHSSTSTAEELVKELKGRGARAEAFKADLTEYGEVRPFRNDQFHNSTYLSLSLPLVNIQLMAA